MRYVALLALAGCIEGGEPDTTEMVVYAIAEPGDVVITGGMIRWTDGSAAHEASLADAPISNRENVSIGETRGHLVVHGDSVYLADTTGVLAVTNGAPARVVTQPGVNRVAVTDDGTVYWMHDAGGLSWYGAGGQVKSVYMNADAVVEIAAAKGELYATTIGAYNVGPLGTIVRRGKLFHVDRSAGQAMELATADGFASEFIDNHEPFGDVYESGGLYAFGDELYWSVYDNAQSTEYSQRLVKQLTTSGLITVLGPQERASEIWVHDDAFYWNADSTLWRAHPSTEREAVLAGTLRAVTVSDGYAYGFVPSLSGAGLFDLRRVPL